MSHKKLINKKPQSFAIIAGKYGGRKLPFTGDETLRPTPNRVRETLFNWLQFDIKNKTALDCFAGSGALGFEALSRGASSVVLCEKNLHTSNQLAKNIELLQTGAINLITSDIFTSNISKRFDFVFLDPPFSKNLIDKTLLFLREKTIADENTIIYIESEYQIPVDELPFSVEIIKQKKASSVFYCLIKIKS